MKHKLVEILKCGKLCGKRFDDQYSDATIAKVAEHLLDNGALIAVYCKDCKHFVDGEVPYCRHRKGITVAKPYSFCSYGERRNDIAREV